MKRFAWAAALVACGLTAGCEFTVQSGEDPQTPPQPPANGTQPATTPAPRASLGQRIGANARKPKIDLVALLKGRTPPTTTPGGTDGGGGGDATPVEDGVGKVIVTVVGGTCDDFLVDGLTIGSTTGFESPITTGEHEFQCIPEGKDPQTQTANIAKDTTTELTFDLNDPNNTKVTPVAGPPPEGRPTPETGQ